MLRELLVKHSDQITFFGPATESEIALAAETLGARFPPSLEAALRESNGVQGEYGLDLLWDVSRIVSDNQLFRTNSEFLDLYMPFDSLLFFSDAGNGDQFAFTILNGKNRRDDIYVWNHEDDSRCWVAPSMEIFYEWWLTGRITT